MPAFCLPEMADFSSLAQNAENVHKPRSGVDFVEQLWTIANGWQLDCLNWFGVSSG